MTKLKTIQTDKAPAAIGPFSQAIEFASFVYCSGQIGSDPKTGKLVEGVEKQTRQVLQNLTEVLHAAGSDLSQVIKTTIYLRDMTNFATVNKIYAEFFSSHKPARATVEVSNLPLDALVEMETVAVKKG